MASAADLTAVSPAWRRSGELVLPVGVIACILVILIPLPAALIDVLLVASITMSVIVLLTSIQVRTPLEFSVFPSLLLAATLGRLVLNIATTRLILTQAESDGARAAGGVIQTFGDFVAGGNILVGLIIFSIIVVIQFVVITKGATRISEVAARFALDGMPGRQMAIDADLGAKTIDKHQAEQRRDELHRQADFLGAMDGASKFVRGDAIAGLVITMVNIVGGLVVGIAQAGLSPIEAGQLFTRLTIGDGLASQLPALLISLAAGLLVTRSGNATNLPSEFLRQLFSRPQVLAVAGGFLGLLIFTSLPLIPLLFVAGGCLALAYLLSKQQSATVSAEHEAAADNQIDRPVEQWLAVDPLEIELGLGLIKLADRQRGGELLQQIQHVRQEMASCIGIIIPKVRVRDNMRLRANQFRIKLAETIVAEGTATSADSVASLLSDCVRRHADELLTRDATQFLVEQLKKSNPVVVSDLIPDKLSLAQVQQVLQLLLREQVPIRQLAQILEALGDYAGHLTEPVTLAEYVRQRLARTISSQYRDRHRVLRAVELGCEVEQRIDAGVEESARGFRVRLPAHEVDAVCAQIADSVERLSNDGHPPILLVNPLIRATVKHLTAAKLPKLVVLSYNEITPDTDLEIVTEIGHAESIAA
jgi:flagellar biosynthesis protein FlhA